MCYNVLDDGTQTRIRCVKAGDDGFSGPSGSIPICVSDVLKLYSALLASAKDQLAIGRTSTRDFPLKQFNHMSARIPIHQATRGEVSYGSGWARVQLPGPMGDVGCSPPLIPKGMPMVWKGVASQLVMYHQGSLLGTLPVAILIPDNKSAIVVLTNSLSLDDIPDWVEWLVLEELRKVPERNHYIQSGRTSAAENAKWYAATTEELQKQRRAGTSPRSQGRYVGIY